MTEGVARRTAWFHCSAGVAGDMVLGALLDAGADVEEVSAIVAALGVSGWSLASEPANRQGLVGTRAVVNAPEDPVHHRPYRHIVELLADAPLPERVAERARATFAALAEVEGALHGVEPGDVEFHEVGALDAIVDVVGASAALELLGVDTVACSTIAVGHGTVTAAHGTLPNPAPAVTALAARHGLVLTGIDDHRELATPTGVALMAALSTSTGALPTGRVVATGLGAGSRDTPGRPNFVQVVIVENTTIDDRPVSPLDLQDLVVVETNIDDVTGEVLAHTVERLLAVGALDAWVTPIVMKKGRPAHTVHALCSPDLVADVRDVLFSETGTLGVRAVPVQRWAVLRHTDTVDVDGHPVRVKHSRGRAKAEWDDAAAAAIALGRPLREIQTAAEEATR